MLQLSVFGDGGLNRVTEESCLIHVDKKYNVVWCVRDNIQLRVDGVSLTLSNLTN